MPTCEKEFFDWLSRLDCKSLKVYAMQNGLVNYSYVFMNIFFHLY